MKTSLLELCSKWPSCVNFCLVYSSGITIYEAVACAYRLGSTDQLHAATLINPRQTHQEEFNDATPLFWLSSAEELDDNLHEVLSEQLTIFLTFVLSNIAPDLEKYEKTYLSFSCNWTRPLQSCHRWIVKAAETTIICNIYSLHYHNM